MHMEFTNKIIEYLKDKYNPVAIILHASRALSLNRDNSDWDLYVFVDSKVEGGSEKFENQNLDINVIYLPLEEYDFIDYFGTTLRGAKILFDTNDFAKNLITEAENVYGKGRNLSERDLLNRKNRGLRLLERIKGTVSQPELQFYHLGSYYEAVIRYWFELRNECQMPPYKALPYIHEQDLEFYEWLMIISGNQPPTEKSDAAEKIYSKLF